ncbi:MAG: hypothetical protein M0Z76_05555 [Gammaproteobacteria bacterium]|nr:hypothetical protein [Gammaproteobacteria bacterium]
MLLSAVALNARHEVHFAETTRLSSLTRPLETSGRLIYRKPSTLIMRQQRPAPVTYRIVGERLYVNGHRGVSIDRVPQLMAIVSGFEGLLSGNRALLQHDYTLHLRGSARQWRLRLVPRLAALAKVVRTIEVRGHDGEPTEVRTTTPKGDFSVMRLSP